jgi:superfamily II DNA or RNA helicase
MGPSVHEVGITEAIREGMLAPVDVYLAKPVVDLTGIKMSPDGDYDAHDLETRIRAGDIEDSPAKLYKELFYRDLSDFDQVMVFCATQDQADSVAQEFVRLGIQAEADHSGRTKGDREEVERRFRAGELPVLVNVRTKTRGANYPQVKAVFNFSPTTRAALALHRSGRATRLWGDTVKVVVDWVYKTDTHSSQVLFSEILGAVSIRQHRRDTVSKEADEGTREARSSILLGNVSVVMDTQLVAQLTHDHVAEKGSHVTLQELSVSPEWVSTGELSEELGVEPSSIVRNANKFLEEVENRHLYVKVVGTERKVHRRFYSREVADYLRKIFKTEQKPSSWLSIQELYRYLKVKEYPSVSYNNVAFLIGAFIGRIATEDIELYSRRITVSRKGKGKGGSASENIVSPEVQEHVEREISQRQPRPAGWLNALQMAKLLNRTRNLTMTRIRRVLADVPPEDMFEYVRAGYDPEDPKRIVVDNFSPAVIEAVERMLLDQPVHTYGWRSASEIASSLGRTPATIRYHLNRFMRDLGDAADNHREKAYPPDGGGKKNETTYYSPEVVEYVSGKINT